MDDTKWSTASHRPAKCEAYYQYLCANAIATLNGRQAVWSPTAKGRQYQTQQQQGKTASTGTAAARQSNKTLKLILAQKASAGVRAKSERCVATGSGTQHIHAQDARGHRCLRAAGHSSCLPTLHTYSPNTTSSYCTMTAAHSMHTYIQPIPTALLP
jgi:hypothetical protein